MIKKELEILKRTHTPEKVRTKLKPKDRLFFALIAGLSGSFLDKMIIVKPDTVLKWYRQYLKSKWFFPHKTKSKGRPQTEAYIKNLVLKMKNENILWGLGKIKGELLKLGIALDKKTISNIIASFRKKGMVKTSLTWDKFIKLHMESLFSMDFFTVDTIWSKRFYVLFIMSVKSRKIVSFFITQHPTKEFVRQRIMDFRNSQSGKIYLIHDNGPELCAMNYTNYGITDIKTSIRAPNMNAFAERFVKSVRTESLDWFIIFTKHQLKNILSNYINYYNSQRPHQGIEQKIPEGYLPKKSGKVVSIPVLFGLHHHYDRISA